MNILIIEPDKILAQTYARSLESAGHRTTSCWNAAATLDALEKQQPDLIILELQLAGHGGIELLHELRSYPEWQCIPVLLHTLVPAHSLEINQAALQNLSIKGYLYKPQTSLSQLISMVNHLLQPISV